MKGLKYISQFLTSKEQSLLLNSSLNLLSNVKHSNSISRRLQRQFIKLNPNHNNNNFMSNDAYYFQDNHFDNVIINFRELLSNPSDWQQDDESLNIILNKIFNLLPSHHQHNQQLHLLHLAENGKINPHIDNQQASGSIIIGISLGGERILKFKKSTTTNNKTIQGPDEFQILLQPGSAYIQSYVYNFLSFSPNIIHSTLNDTVNH
jgi:alkylated DNA repair protein alkB family protein 7